MRIKKYIDSDVLSEARKRVSETYDMFDNVVVCTSFGKDSTVSLYLAKEQAQKRNKKVEAIFRDEELIPNSVVEYGKRYLEMDWINLRWYAIPLRSTKYILGQTFNYTQWDKNREHVRAIPEWAITLKDGDDRVFDQYTADEFVCEGLKGSVALITGIRTDESLMRLRSVLNRVVEPHIANTKNPRIKLVRPIYDWSENDVFKFLGENEIPWCEHYNSQFYADEPLRISTPLHAEQAKRISSLRSIDPELYDGILKIFPEVSVQDRYYRSLDRETIREQYGRSLDGVRSYIEDKYDDEEQKTLAIKRFDECRNLNRVNPSAYPILHILRYFVGGSLKRLPLPMGKHETSSR